MNYRGEEYLIEIGRCLATAENVPDCPGRQGFIYGWIDLAAQWAVNYLEVVEEDEEFGSREYVEICSGCEGNGCRSCAGKGEVYAAHPRD